MNRKRPKICNQDEDNDSFPPTCNMQPLSVTDLPTTWRNWYQQFQIYLVAHFDQPPNDRKKLAIFLNFLGPDALEIVNSMFPDLRDFDSPAALQLSFEEEVLPAFQTRCRRGHALENFKETVDLLQIEVNNEGSIECLYKDLVAKSKSTGIECCADRMVRNYLVQNIDDMDILEEIQRMNSPSALEVVEEYLKLERDIECFTHVFPYLTTADQIRLSIAWPFISNIFSHDNRELLIDAELLEEFPIKDHREWYSRDFEVARTVTLQKLSEDQVMEVFPFLEKVRELKLVQIEVLREFPTNVPKLRKLALIDCIIEEQYLGPWMNKFEDVRQLHLENLEYDLIDPTRPLNLGTIFCESLVLIGESVKLEGHCAALIHLKIVAKKIDFRFFKLGHCLQTVDCDGPAFLVPQMRCLKSVKLREWGGIEVVPRSFASEEEEQEEMESYPYDSYPDELDPAAEITILNPVGREHEAELLYLNRRCKLTYTLREKPVVAENLIFDMLDDGCLERIVEYLTKRAFKDFAQTNLRIYKLFQKNRLNFVILFSSTDVDDFIKEMQVERFYNRSPVIKAVRFVRPMKVSDNQFDRLPIGFRELEVDSNVSGNGWAGYLRRLNPTLHYLDWSEANDEYLLQLHNIRKLTISSSYNGDHLLQFLNQNRETLEEVTIGRVECNISKVEKYNMIMQLLASLPNLRHLSIKAGWVRSSTNITRHTRTTLTDQQVWPHLKRLTIEVCDHFRVLLEVDRYPCLEDLTVDFDRVFCKDDLHALCSLVNLRKLKLIPQVRGSYMSEDDLLTLVGSLPNLTQLQLPYIPGSSIKFGRKFREYIKQNRPLLGVYWLHTRDFYESFKQYIDRTAKEEQDYDYENYV